MLRSETIKRAQESILQGESDPHWTNNDWNDFFHDALDMISEELDAAGAPYLIVTDAIITKNSSDQYPLPDGYKTLLRVQMVDDSSDIYPKRDNLDVEVYERINDYLVLQNWATDLPSTLKIRYRRFHPTVGSDSWDGTDDSDIPTNRPQPPLDNYRGSRLLEKLIKIFAKSKDEDLTAEEAEIAKNLINAFVIRITGSEDEVIEQEIGT